MAQNRTKAGLHVACEIAPGRVVAARRSATGHIEVAHARTLASGTITPALMGDNVHSPDALRDAVTEALEAIGGRGRDIITIVPDAVARVVLLDFETFPERRDEADGIIRFRLKKSVPFDIDKASLSYDVRRTAKGTSVVAAVAQTAVVQQYESAITAAGFQPGVVLPSLMASLGLIDAERPTLVIKVDATNTSVAIVNEDQLLLYRTLEGATSSDRLAEDIYPSLVFLQDNYQMSVENVLVGGVVNVQDLAPALEQQTGARVHELVDASLTPTTSVPKGELAGVMGALLA